MHSILLLTFCLVVPSCTLVFEEKKVNLPPSSATEVIQYGKRFAGNMESCEKDEDCLNPVQKCVILEMTFYFISFCICPIEFPSYFDEECHKPGECRLDIHCPHNMSYCSLNANSSLGVCQCPDGDMRDDGTCPQETEIPALGSKDSYHGRTDLYNSNDDDKRDWWLLQKQILILSVVAVIVVLILFIGCWRMARRSRLEVDTFRRNDNVAQTSRQDSPSARRFLSTRPSHTVSSTHHQTSETSRPSSSRRQNISQFTCTDPRTTQEPPPSYEELFGSSILPSGPSCPSEGHQRQGTSSTNSRDREGNRNTTYEGQSYFTIMM